MPDGRFHVTFPEYGNSDILPPTALRPLSGLPRGPTAQTPAPAPVPTPAPTPPASFPPAHAFHQPPPGPEPTMWQLGDMCEAMWSVDQIYYVAKVDAALIPGLTYLVTFVEYGNQDQVNVEHMRPLPRPAVAPAPPKPAVPQGPRVGDIVEAKWSEDGVWYVSRIDQITPQGLYHVFFVEYGNTDTVPLSSIRPRPNAQQPVARSAPQPTPQPAPQPAPSQTAFQQQAFPPLSSQPPPQRTPQQPSSSPVAPTWKVGQQLEARWNEDKAWYLAVIDSITPNGLYNVTFTEYGNTDRVKADSLRPLPQKQQRQQSSSPSPQGQRGRNQPQRVSLQSLQGGEKELPRGPSSSQFDSRDSRGPPSRSQTTTPSHSAPPPQQQQQQQQRPASTPAGPAKEFSWFVNAPCEVRDSMDNKWHKARVIDIVEDGKRFVVKFEDFNKKLEIGLSDIRPAPVEQVQQADLGFTASLQIDRFMKKLYPDRESEPPKPFVPFHKQDLSHVPVADVGVSVSSFPFFFFFFLSPN